MSWFLLSIAIPCVIVGTTSMKLSNGFMVLPWSVAVTVRYAFFRNCNHSGAKNAETVRRLAYLARDWHCHHCLDQRGFFYEPLSSLKIFGILAIIIGVISLRFASS